MQNHATDSRTRRIGLPMLWVVALLALVFGSSAMQAQLNGTYTIGGGSGTYADIPTAISALNTNGISGPVTFLIRSTTNSSGAHTISSTQSISNFTRTAGAATALVTFRPDAGATVAISGNISSSGLFILNGAHHIVFDGSNNGTTSRNMSITNTTTSGSVIIMQNNADVNTVKNCQLQSNSSYYPTTPSSTGYSYSYGGIIHIWYGATAAGNDTITIRNNQFGDPSTSPTYRYAVGVSAFGYSNSSASYLNQALKIVGNDFVNFGNSASYNMAIQIGQYNQNTTVDSNEIRMTSSSYPSSPYLIGISRADYYGNSPGFFVRGNNIHDLRSSYTSTSYFYGIYDYNYYSGYYFYNSGYSVLANDTSLISDNQIYNFQNTYSSHSGSIYYYGVYSYPAYTWGSSTGAVAVLIRRNQIHDFAGTYGYYPTYYGIYCYGYNTNSAQSNNATIDISGNQIYNFTAPSTVSNYYVYEYGIYYYGYYSRAKVNIDSNSIHDMTKESGQLSYGYSNNFYAIYAIADYAGNYGTPDGDLSVSKNQTYNIGRTSSLSNYDYYYVYGVYLSAYQPGNRNIVVDKNRVSSFYIPSSGSYPYLYWYGLYSNVYYMSSGYRYSVSNNMVSLNAGTFTGLQNLYGYYVYGAYGSGWTGELDYNSVYVRATGTTSYVYPSYIYTYYSNSTVNHKNNIYDIVTNYGYPLYWYTYQTTFNSDRNLINVSTSNTSSYPVIYFVNQSGSGYTYSSFSAYVSGQGKDQASILGTAPFVNTATGDLHISCSGSFPGKGAGTPIATITTDYDNETRSATGPDIGADETDKLTLTYPNGGEVKVTEDTANIRFTASKTMSVNIFLSTNNGANWSQVATNFPAVAGPNTFTIPAASFPAAPTNQALVYLAANAGLCQLYDTSNAVFRIVKPTVTILTPNGGEEMVPTDTTQIRWSSTNVPPTISIQLQYSSNNGGSWTNIGAPVASPNNVTNQINWIVPNNATPNPITTNLIRGILLTRTEGDTTDRTFTIRPTPIVDLLLPAGGETFYVGRTTTVTWNARTVDYLMIDYSVDGGINWQTIVPRVPSYLGQYEWTVPNTLTNNAIMRISDPTRPRFTDRSTAFSIVKDSIAVLSPNGGESYQLGAPITVNWYSQNIGTVKVEFSSNGGSTWTEVGSGINAGNFTYSFTPAEVPTEQALVRITSEQNAARTDVSDAFFQIAPAANIVVYTPVAGDRLVRNSTSVITWQADGINKVNILYSSNGGSTWSTVVNDVQAAQSSYLWTVPNQTTNQGVIEIREVGGSLRARSGVFQIVDPATPGTITVLTPNGGESYTEGDAINVSWTASGVGPLTVQYSMNSGNNWTTIASGVTGSSYAWTAPATPGTHYRVRVLSTSPVANDASDADFSVIKRPIPSLALLYPNGGENLTIDSTYNVRWNASNVTGNVDISYTTDGTTWTPVGTAAASAGQYAWTIPNDPTMTARVKITAGALNDTSDAVFEISRRIVLPITVIYPNGGEIIRHNDIDSVVWDAPGDVSSVKIEYSVDGGSTNSWVMITPNVPSVAGRNTYIWDRTPNLAEIKNSVLVRVTENLPGTRSDISDAPFTITGILGVAMDAVTGGARISATVVPNPNSGRAELRWNQPASGEVTVTLMQPNGAEAGTFAVGRREAGAQTYAIDASTLPNGMYLYELRIGGNATRGMMVITR